MATAQTLQMLRKWRTQKQTQYALYHKLDSNIKPSLLQAKNRGVTKLRSSPTNKLIVLFFFLRDTYWELLLQYTNAQACNTKAYYFYQFLRISPSLMSTGKQFKKKVKGLE